MELTEETRVRLQNVQLELALEVKRICEKHNIKYFLDGGTLLGAVRHKGFIPWDDDLDIGMPREEYKKFLKLAPPELGSEYFLQEWHTEKGYGLPFAKIRKNNTKYLESTARDVSAHSGIYIDIFPFDSYGASMIKQGFLLMLLRRLILVKCGYKQWEEQSPRRAKKKLIYLPLRFLAKFFNRDKMIGRYEKAAQKYNGDASVCEVFHNSSSNYSRHVIPKKCIDETVLLPFEGVMFPCPKGYDEQLTCAYGDYMQPPPVEKRFNRHNIAELKFE